LRELVLHGAGDEIIADAGGNIEALAGEIAIADDGTNLVGRRLDQGIALQTELSDGEVKFAVGLHFEEGADGRDFTQLRVVLQDLLGVITAAGREPEIADDRRPVARRRSEGKGSDGIESLKDVALAGDEGAAKRGIEIMLLDDVPGEEIDGLVVAVFDVEMLGEAVFEFVGVGEGGVAVEANEIGEVVSRR